MATKKIWSDDDNQKFIQLVKENAILWDARSDEYNFSERKPMIWKKIVEGDQETKTKSGTKSGE